MSQKKRIFILIFLVVLLAACASASEDAQFSERSSALQAPSLEEPAYDVAGETAVADIAYEAEEITFAESADGAAAFADTGNESTVNQVERLIIRTASMSLVVTDTEDTLASISNMAERNGGWVVSSNVYEYNAEAKSGDITIRIPVSGFNSAMEGLRDLAVKVEQENISGQDVTEEFVDLEARLGNLEATADRVRNFLDDAETVEEALAVNQELSRLEGEIGVIKGRMQYLSQSAAFSTISVFLTPDIAVQPVQIGGWRPQGVAKEAIEALIGTLQGLATFAIWIVIYILPIVLLIGIPLVLVWRFIWRRWQRRKE